MSAKTSGALTRRTKYAVVLGKGQFVDEVDGHAKDEGPRRNYIELAKALDADVCSYVVACHRWGWLFRTMFARAPLWGSALYTATRLNRYDGLFVTGEDVGLRLLLLIALLRSRTQIFIVVHNLTRKKARLIRALQSFRNVDYIVLCSAQKNALAELANVKTDRIHLVLEGIDTVFFSADQTGTQAPETAGQDSTSFMACGAEARDYQTLINAVRLRPFSVSIYGRGYTAENVLSADDPDLPASVRLQPRVSYDALCRAYLDAEAVILPLQPSDYASGLNGALEAMAMGKPLVVSRTAGLTDYVEHDPGVVVAPGDANALAAAATAILSDRDLFDDIGRRNRAWVVHNCDIEVNVRQLEQLIRRPANRSAIAA